MRSSSSSGLNNATARRQPDPSNRIGGSARESNPLTGTALAITAYLGRANPSAMYGAAIIAYFMVLSRSMILPSTGTRTAITGTITCLPIFVSSIAVGVLQDPATAAPFAGATLVIIVIVVSVAAMGSRIIYGLRQKVSAALQLGQYTLVGKIGQGGMGTVYRARHALLRRPTAIKLIHPDSVSPDTIDRFEREVQHTSQLTHPNTVHVYDFGRSQGLFYYAMEYLDGLNLDELVKAYGPQPADRVVAILAQVCGALHEAHGNGIVHRDIKPENIILCQRGAIPDVAKVVDFGLVKEISREEHESARVILGTPAFIAPEAVTAPAQVGPPADIYAVAAVGYFLLTGKPMFEGNTALALCLQHVEATAVPPSRRIAGVPAALEHLLLACLAKHPSARPTAEHLGQRLARLAPAGTWSTADAKAWWKRFHEQRPPATDWSEARTITVDLGNRDLAPTVLQRPDPPKRAPRARRAGSAQPSAHA